VALFLHMNKSNFSNAGRELLKGNLGNAAKALFVDENIDHSSYQGFGNGAWWFSPDGLTDIHFSYTGIGAVKNAFTKCPPLNAVINRKAQAFINGRTVILNSTGKEANSEYAKKLKALLKRPNPLQSWKQFEAQYYIYQQLFGYAVILPIKPFGFDAIDATALWNIPPFMCSIEERDDISFTKLKNDGSSLIKSIWLEYGKVRIPLNVQDVFILKDFTPSFKSLIIPESRICALELPINNVIGAYEARNTLINYRGALGMITQETGSGPYGNIAVTEKQKENLQQDLARYGIRSKQWQFIVTEASLKWQQMGFPTKDLMLFEEIGDDIMRICDAYNYPSPLINSDKGPAVANTKEYKQQLYEDGIIPESESIYEQLNQLFKTEEYNLSISKTYDHLAVMQKDKQSEATARKTLGEAVRADFFANFITFNRALELMGEPQRPNGDIYYFEAIQQGLSFAIPGGQKFSNDNANTQQNGNSQQGQQQQQ